jgi:vanillate/4-hydroxybenzoate decarboxylase subunit D
MACSPVSGAWQLHLCGTCFYGWRTSEPAPLINPDLYDARFRLTPDQLAKFKELPPVPRAGHKP